ncbi:MAG: FHA domain-containing protein [Lentisphaerae bacterium]|nr:MAG: FHA domain-containing protein [Lentisphaerota bacterium]
MPKLIVQQGYYERGEFELKKGETILGRDASCDIMLPDNQVSRKHARFTYDGKVCYVEDLGSFNGTFLNWQPLREKHVLKHLDVLQICKNVFVYNEDDSSNDNDESLDLDDVARTRTSETFTIDYLRDLMHKIEGNIQKVFKGKSDVVRNVLVCMLADGHVLLEDAPGVGKSILAQATAKSIQATFRRIQFTPDMLPSDITGLTIYNEQMKEFKFVPGPIFGNIILADEINRTTPRTQSSLLECMNDGIVTVDGVPHVLPKPFFVIATQNPMHHHGTYPLPEAQLDRFLMRINIGYPDPMTEKEILASQMSSHPLNSITYVARALDIVQCSALVRRVHVANAIKDYIIQIANATREHPALVNGISPRASLALMRAGQALAAYSGRRYVIPSDIRSLAPYVLAHRLQLKLRAQADYNDSAQVIEAILHDIPDDLPEDSLKED